MKKIYFALIVTFLVLTFIYFLRLNPSATSNVIESEEDELEGKNELIIAENLAKHNKESDCWIGYNNKIYDVTAFLPRHPGSAVAIIPYCGTHDEFSKAFTEKHGTSKVANLMKVGALIGDFQIRGEI